MYFGWYKSVLWIGFELLLFWLKDFLLKWPKLVHFRVLDDTPTPRHKSARLGLDLRLGGLETPLEKFLLRLSQATVPILFFLWLILEPVTLLFDFQ